jgi:curved DNA-binding protein
MNNPSSARSRTAQRSGNSPQYEFGGTGFSDFFEQFFGRKRQGSSNGSSSGSDPKGLDLEAEMVITLEESTRGGLRTVTVRKSIPCKICEAAGMIGDKVCHSCQGQGQMGKLEQYKVRIPPGIKEGQKLRLAGHGESGGIRKSGDLYLKIRFAAHPDFRVSGGRIHYDLELTPWEAALGAEISVPTLNGPVTMKIPSGTQNQQQFRLRGSPDDLIVVAHIRVPKELNSREKMIWEQLARESNFKPREI